MSMDMMSSSRTVLSYFLDCRLANSTFQRANAPLVCSASTMALGPNPTTVAHRNDFQTRRVPLSTVQSVTRLCDLGGQL